MSDEELDPDDLALDLSEFADGPEEELARLKDKSSENDTFLNSTYNSDNWFIKPLHRTTSAPVDIEEIARRQPLKASVLRSAMEGNVTSVPSEKIRTTPINDFDLSLFREAENHMLSSRTISALATPYQEELARLRLDRLRLEEERLLKKNVWMNLKESVDLNLGGMNSRLLNFTVKQRGTMIYYRCQATMKISWNTENSFCLVLEKKRLHNSGGGL